MTDGPATGRVVSLLPSATEIVFLLGQGDRLVGCSHECDVPPEVESLPICSAPKFPTDGTSYQIEERMRALVQEGLSVYRVDAAALDRVGPDLILTQDQCEVCAVDLSEVREAVCTLVGSNPRIHSVSPRTLDDIWGDIVSIGEALGVPDAGRERVKELQRRTAAIADRAASASRRPTVLSVEWLEPLMTGGNWMPELISLAGGESVRGEAGKHSPWMEWETVLEADPELLILLPCGFGIERTRAELDVLTGRTGWDALRAVRSGDVYLLDGHHYFNRPGPRIVESLEILAEILHPDRFDFGHRGTGWERI